MRKFRLSTLRWLALLLFLAPEAQDAGDKVVSVREAVGLDCDEIADDALDRKAAVIDLR